MAWHRRNGWLDAEDQSLYPMQTIGAEEIKSPNNELNMSAQRQSGQSSSVEAASRYPGLSWTPVGLHR